MWRKHFLLWISAIAIIIIGGPIFVEESVVWNAAQKEINLIEKAFGPEDTQNIVNSATASYNSAFVTTGFIQPIKTYYITQRDQNERKTLRLKITDFLTRINNKYIRTFSALIYIILLRLNILKAWIPYIFPFLAAVLFDGFLQKQVKAKTFGQLSSNTFAIAIHFGILSFYLPFLYLIVPIPFTPLFIPMWALLSALPLSMAIANSAPLLPTGN